MLSFSHLRPNPPDLDARLSEALTRLYAETPSILLTTERPVVGRLLLHLHSVFADLTDTGHTWDLDYARDRTRTKALEISAAEAERYIIPDLIWHRRLLPDENGRAPRRHGSDNLIAIEVKLGRPGTAAGEHDVAKLAVLTDTVAQVHLVGEWLQRIHRTSALHVPQVVTRPESLGAYRIGLALALHEHCAEVQLLSARDRSRIGAGGGGAGDPESQTWDRP